MSDDAIVILAAGKGTRMQSSLPKVLHMLAGKPMFERVLDAVECFEIPMTAVVGYGAELLRERYGDRCSFVIQTQQRGTGHAARVAMDSLPPSVRRILLVHGDEPLIDSETYAAMLDLHARTQARVVLLSATVKDTRNFGRVKRDWRGQPVRLVQEADLLPEEHELNEVNLGAYVFDASYLREALPRLRPHPPKNEYYLTDLVSMAATERHDTGGSGPVVAVTLEDGEELLGVNSLIQLEHASGMVYRRTNRRLMESGVTIIDSASTFIDETAWIAPGTVILPFTIIEGHTHIGADCTIGPHAHIESSHIGRRCIVRASTLELTEVSDDVRIGPYAHVRPGSHIGGGAEIGNYAEIKGATIGAGTKMHHFGYVGDAEIGQNVNIGAGVVTANYDGTSKHRTIVEDDAFVGSGTMLRAPVRIGQGAYTGAGSVVTRDVPPKTIVMGVPARPKQGEGTMSDTQGGRES